MQGAADTDGDVRVRRHHHTAVVEIVEHVEHQWVGRAVVDQLVGLACDQQCLFDQHTADRHVLDEAVEQALLNHQVTHIRQCRHLVSGGTQPRDRPERSGIGVAHEVIGPIRGLEFQLTLEQEQYACVFAAQTEQTGPARCLQDLHQLCQFVELNLIEAGDCVQSAQCGIDCDRTPERHPTAPVADFRYPRSGSRCYPPLAPLAMRLNPGTSGAQPVSSCFAAATSSCASWSRSSPRSISLGERPRR